MKFAEMINANGNPEWILNYLCYDQLKKMLQDGLLKAPKKITSSEINDGKLNFIQYLALFDDNFFRLCDQELDKINLFCREKVHEYVEAFLDLKTDAEYFLNWKRERFYQDGDDKGHTHGKDSTENELKLEAAFKKFYANLRHLSHYQEINYFGFKKILYKHDKQFWTSNGDFMLKSKVDLSYFHLVKDIKKLLQETEMVVAGLFDGGSRQRAIKRLAILPPKVEMPGPWAGFKLGLMAGTCIVLLALLSVSGLSTTITRQLVRFYRGPFILVFYLFLIGVDLHAWMKFGINHVHIFGLDPASHMIPHQFWNVATFFGIVWAISIVTFLNAKNIGLPVYIAPFAMIASQLLFLFNPFPFGYSSARRWLLRILFRIFTAPFHPVSFGDFWMCDQLSSLISLLLDYIYTICFFFNTYAFFARDMDDPRLCLSGQPLSCPCDSPTFYWRPVMRALPAFLRVIQCLRRYYDNPLVCPHLVNGLKYLLSLTSTILSALQGLKVKIPDHPNAILYTWITVSTCSSIMSYCWDIRMDWGLGNPRATNRFIRNEMLYSQAWYYYASIIGDFFLRFSWAISLSLTDMKFAHPDIMLSITTPLEIFRRFVWNLFRLENEQINNNKAQRAAQTAEAVKSITSFHLTEEQQMMDILRIMDLPENGDGLVKKKGGGHGRTGPGSFTSFEFFKSSRSELFTKVHGSQSQLEFEDASNFSSMTNMLEPDKSLWQKMKEVCCNCYGYSIMKN